VSARGFAAAASGIGVLLWAVTAGHAQSPSPAAAPEAAPPSVSSFVPPYEIIRTVRSAGFTPLAPPLRQGTTYVLRAADYRGILMRVVVDARSAGSGRLWLRSDRIGPAALRRAARRTAAGLWAAARLRRSRNAAKPGHAAAEGTEVSHGARDASAAQCGSAIAAATPAAICFAQADGGH
jgi:hypothetical protein